jgi:hypothetical protein
MGPERREAVSRWYTKACFPREVAPFELPRDQRGEAGDKLVAALVERTEAAVRDGTISAMNLAGDAWLRGLWGRVVTEFLKEHEVVIENNLIPSARHWKGLSDEGSD